MVPKYLLKMALKAKNLDPNPNFILKNHDKTRNSLNTPFRVTKIRKL